MITTTIKIRDIHIPKGMVYDPSQYVSEGFYKVYELSTSNNAILVFVYDDLVYYVMPWMLFMMGSNESNLNEIV